MSCNYADGLSPYPDKGQLGLDERFDSKSVVDAKVSLLAKWMNEAKHVVIHTGAGISTSAGIPDFRGPRGVWTLEAKGEKPDTSKDFNEAIPTATHMAITRLVEKDKVKYVVSQNIDGLHLRSNLQRKFLSELHGNMFTEQCNACNRQFVRNSAVPTVGQKSLNKACPTVKPTGRPCRGRLHDTILDWEHNLPENDLGMADYHSCLSDLSICLGTTMQIVPSGNLPLYTKKHGGRLVICNLQPTKHDRKADLLIHAYVDDIMTKLMKHLNLKIPKYTTKNDPTKTLSLSSETYFEWTISDYTVKKMKKVYEEKCGTKEAKKRLEMIDDDLPLSLARTLKRRAKEEEDSDLEVLDVIVKPKKGGGKEAKEGKEPKEPKETPKRGPKKNNASTPAYNSTITVKKVTPPAKKPKYEGEKITIKKNVTPTKTKYEIVQTKPKKVPKCEIVYNTDSDVCNDLDMICESDDDEPNVCTSYNFRRYLYDEKETKKEIVKKEEGDQKNEASKEVKDEVKEENNVADSSKENKEKQDDKVTDVEVKSEDVASEDSEKNKETEKNDVVTSPKDVNDTTAKEKDTSVEEEASQSKIQTSEENALEEQSQEPPPLTTSPKGDSEAVLKEKRNDNDSSSAKNVDLEEKTLESETANEERAKETLERLINAELSHESENNSTSDKEAVENLEKSAVSVAKELELQLNESTNRPEESNITNVLTNSGEGPKNLDSGTDKQDNLYNTIESELSSLSGTNIVSSIDQFVSQSDSTQFDNALTIPETNINPTINEEYAFYGNDYASTNTPADLDYVTNNYYNHF